MKNILLATKNPGKILEYNTIFKEFKLLFNLLTIKDLNILEDAEENQETFEKNAIKKADFYSQFTDLPILAEDSGLEIDYLNGEPGVRSRRWPGYEAIDEELLDMLFQKMEGVPKEKRGAQFKVVLALKISKNNKPVISEGILRGFIAEKPTAKIIPGFPFRSLFFVPELGKTLGEITIKEESKIAHRRIAIEKLMPELQKIS